MSLLTLQEQSSQTGQNFGRWIRNKTKNLCSTEICLLTTKALYSFNLLFFRVPLLPQQNEIQLVSRFFLSSKPFSPGNWIQSLAMPMSVMNARGDFHIKVTGVIVFSLWGANCRFWSHLECLGWKVIQWGDTNGFYCKYNPTQRYFLCGQLIRLNPI